MMKAILKLCVITIGVFAILTFTSLLIDEGNIGLPLVFYKDACSLSVNIETGQEFGTTFEVDYWNLTIDVLVSFIVALSSSWLVKQYQIKNTKMKAGLNELGR